MALNNYDVFASNFSNLMHFHLKSKSDRAKYFSITTNLEAKY